MFTSLFEAPEAEVARLAAAPVGSINHTMSLLPVKIHSFLQDLMIELPQKPGVNGPAEPYTIVVVPFLRHASSRDVMPAPMELHRGSWDCIVVASDHPAYHVGGHRLNVSEAELVRGTPRTLELATSSTERRTHVLDLENVMAA